MAGRALEVTSPQLFNLKLLKMLSKAADDGQPDIYIFQLYNNDADDDDNNDADAAGVFFWNRTADEKNCRQHCRLSVCFSETNPNDNLMMRRAGLSKKLRWCESVAL